MAMKNFFTKEVKIGLSVTVALALLIWGFNFLKGINLFTPTNHYYLKYEKLDGLVVSNGVYINGFKIGQVDEIKYDFTKAEPFGIRITINKDIVVPQGSIAYLFDESMLGEKGINLVLSDAKENHSAGDTLTCAVDQGLFGTIAELVPTLKSTINHADSLIVSVQDLVNSPEIAASLDNIKSMTAELQKSSLSLSKVMNNDLPLIVDNIGSVTNDLRGITDNLNKIDFNDIAYSIDTTMTNLQQFTERINSTDGTIGLLLNDKGLYNELTNTMSSANNLLIDLKANPKRYVHFSLFGAKEKKKKEETSK